MDDVKGTTLVNECFSFILRSVYHENTDFSDLCAVLVVNHVYLLPYYLPPSVHRY